MKRCELLLFTLSFCQFYTIFDNAVWNAFTQNLLLNIFMLPIYSPWKHTNDRVDDMFVWFKSSNMINQTRFCRSGLFSFRIYIHIDTDRSEDNGSLLIYQQLNHLFFNRLCIMLFLHLHSQLSHFIVYHASHVLDFLSIFW